MKTFSFYITILIFFLVSGPVYGAVNWKAKINIKANKFTTFLIVGSNRTATDSYDPEWDVPAISPGGDFNVGANEFIHTYIPHKDWVNIFNRYSQDIRFPNYETPKEWFFEVVSNIVSNSPVTIDFSDIIKNVPKGSIVKFLDNQNNEIDIFTNPSYTYNSVKGSVENFAIKVYSIPYNGPVIPTLNPVPSYISEATPKFLWEGTSPGYHIQIADNPRFMPTIIDDDLVTKNSYTPLSGLPDGKIYWRVSSINLQNNLSLNSDAMSPFSSTESFILDSVSPKIIDTAIPNATWDRTRTFYFNTDKDAVVSVVVDTKASIDKVAYLPEIEGWYSKISGLQVGKNNLIITAVDPAGNKSVPFNSFIELKVKKSLKNPDSDGDGMPDYWEMLYNLNPNNLSDRNLDVDSDGLRNIDEYANNTDPFNSDTKGNGILDGNEGGLIYVNSKPIVNAGGDKLLDPGIIILDGSGSSDLDDDTLTYKWSQDINNPDSVIFSNNNSSQAIEQELILVKSGQYRFDLIVNDSKTDSDYGTIYINIKNIPPSADAGIDKIINTGTKVTLNGQQSSDANVDDLIYTWEQVVGPTIPLWEINSENSEFIPLESGVYTFKLIVDDGVSKSQPDFVNITVNLPNIVPTAEAGKDKLVNYLTQLQLDGSKSTDGGDGPEKLLYNWKQIKGPDSIFSDSTLSDPFFTAKVSGIYTFELIVYDGEDYSLPDYVNFTLNIQNMIPEANAGKNQAVAIGEQVTLGGGESFDSDSAPEPLLYKWTQTGGTTVKLSDPEAITPTFFAISEGLLEFSLVVFDGLNYSLPSSVYVTVHGGKFGPVAYAGQDKVGIRNVVITLEGSLKNDNGENNIFYQWRQTEGSNVVLENSETGTPYFTPKLSGIYKFSLTVIDGKSVSLPDEVIVTIEDILNKPPVAVIKGRNVTKEGYQISLDGSGSYDPEKDLLTYNWNQESGSRENILEYDSSFLNATLKKGRYIFTLTVNDGKLDSLPDEFEINVIEKSGKIFKIVSEKDNFFEINRDTEVMNIFFPKGAVEKDTDIGVISGFENFIDVSSEPEAVITNFKIVPEGLELLKSVKIFIEIDFKAKNINSLDRNSYLTTLAVYKYNSEKVNWEYVIDAEKYEGDDKISFKLDNLGQYVVGYNTIVKESSDVTFVNKTPDKKGTAVNNDVKGCFIGFLGVDG